MNTIFLAGSIVHVIRGTNDSQAIEIRTFRADGVHRYLAAQHGRRFLVLECWLAVSGDEGHV